ncbi:MAG: CoA-transferase [Ardenticatenia bacterium]|nr:MAG: CoA-transferase [Ardenticatenia bacterium]
MTFTPREMMVIAAAREIRDGEIVFVGMRLPLVAFVVAKQTHAPNAVGYFGSGLIRETPPATLLYTVSDPANVEGAAWVGSLVDVMGLLATGHVDVGFLGGAQVDRFGNLNTTRIGPARAPRMRLPGSGGAADIAAFAKRTVILMPHESHRLVEEVDYITSPGYGTGDDWRAQVGLPGGGPSAIITTLGVLRFDEHGEAYLASYHPFTTPEEVRAHTGWDLRIAPNVAMTPPPTEAELQALRAYDPEGVWVGTP